MDYRYGVRYKENDADENEKDMDMVRICIQSDSVK